MADHVLAGGGRPQPRMHHHIKRELDHPLPNSLKRDHRMRTLLLPLMLLCLSVQAQYAGGDGRGDVQLSFVYGPCDPPVIAGVTNTGPVCGSQPATLSVVLAAPDGYCEPVVGGGCGAGVIESVDIAGIVRTATGCDNLSGQNGYSLFASPVGALTAGTLDNIYAVTTGVDNSLAAWIDFDQSGSFEESENIFAVQLVDGGTMAVGMFTVPFTAVNGATRLRVRTRDGITVSNNCFDVSLATGETEDYTVVISGGVDGYTYSWAPAFFLDDATSPTPVAMQSNEFGNTETYTVTVTNGCGSSADATTTVEYARPGQGGFSYSTMGGPSTFCTDQKSVPVAVVFNNLTPGGTYTGPSGVVVDPQTGMVSASISEPGGYLITYTVPAGACAEFSTTTLFPLFDPQLWYPDWDNDGAGNFDLTGELTCYPDANLVDNNDDLCPIDPDKIEPGICGCNQPEPGTACDDGLANTVNDVITANCVCQGELTTAILIQDASSVTVRYDRAIGIIALQQTGTGPVHLLDAIGRILSSVKGKAVQFDVRDLPAAVYFVRADEIVQRVVVE